MLFSKKRLATGILAMNMAMLFMVSGCSDKDAKNHKYFHDVDGYYSLVDEGYKASVKKQSEGTSWAYAASVSMESSYKFRYGKDNTFDPQGIMKAVQGPYKEEGYLLSDGVKGDKAGGNTWQITETLSNGVGGCILSEASDYTGMSIDVIKSAIMTNGAMSVSIDYLDSILLGEYDGYTTYNNPYPDKFDYSVVIVGWDDNFPKDYFGRPASQNGAWLVQNGLGEKWGNNGYFWVSYDTAMSNLTVFKVSNEYSSVLSYDGGCENKISTGSTTRVGNVYHHPGLIRGIGTYTTEPNQSITIDIFDGEFKTLLYSQDVTFDIPGYHTVALSKELDLNDFSVAITYSGAAPVEGEGWNDTDISYIVGIDEGQSFVYLNNMWRDMAYMSTVKSLGIDFIPNNGCIKVLY